MKNTLTYSYKRFLAAVLYSVSDDPEFKKKLIDHYGYIIKLDNQNDKNGDT